MRCCEVRCFPREVCFVRRPITSFYCSNAACYFRTSLWRITTVCRRLNSTIPLKIYLSPNKTQFAVPKRRSIIKAPFPALKLLPPVALSLCHSNLVRHLNAVCHSRTALRRQSVARPENSALSLERRLLSPNSIAMCLRKQTCGRCSVRFSKNAVSCP